MRTLRLVILAGSAVLSALAQYQYDYPNLLSSPNSSQWTLNPYGYFYNTGFTAYGHGSAIFTPTVPAPTNGYEVHSTVAFPWWGADSAIYLRATSNAVGYISGGTGTSYVFEVLSYEQSSQQPPTSCAVWLYKLISGASTVLSNFPIPCGSSTDVRAVMTESNYILLYVNNVLYLQTSDTSISTGQPGVGTVESSSVTEVDIGHQDTTPPIPVDPSTIKAYAQPNQVDLQWGATTDDPNGIGLLEYSIYRNGTWLANTPTTTTTFSDFTARPNTTYTYTIYAVDQHLNQAGTSYNVTTPPLTNVVPKTGVRRPARIGAPTANRSTWHPAISTTPCRFSKRWAAAAGA